MPTIRIDDDIFEGLKGLAEPFVDTPNTVIRRLLAEHMPHKPGHEEPAATKVILPKIEPVPPTGTPHKTLTPQPIYEQFLLYVLATDFDGSGTKLEVTQKVIELMNARGYISDADMDRVSTGETKAANTIAWGRNALKERGLISRQSRKGVWELTSRGLDQAKNLSLPSNI